MSTRRRDGFYTRVLASEFLLCQVAQSLASLGLGSIRESFVRGKVGPGKEVPLDWYLQPLSISSPKRHLEIHQCPLRDLPKL